jgi:hypothetical protein
MIDGKKPLSMFYDDADEERDERIIPEGAFGKFVATGQFSKAERVFELAYDPRIGRNRRVRYVLYSLKEWRLEAMFLVLKATLSTPNYIEGLDRMTGYLLGYTDSEVEAYIGSRTNG